MIPTLLNQELDPLGWHLTAGTLTHPAYQDALACIVQRMFNCSTVAFWCVSGLQGERTLACQRHYGAEGEGLPGGNALLEAQFGNYFAMLVDRGVYACDDTLNDQNLDAMRCRYFRPDAPRAFLDALVAINGHALAILSCCQSSGPRHWTVDEETALKRLGARVALHWARLTAPPFGPDRTDHARSHQLHDLNP